MSTTPTDDSIETMVLLDRQIQVRNTTKPLSDLKLDPENPRIRNELVATEADGGHLTESEIEELLWEKDETKKLYRAIQASGGLQKSIYITPGGKAVEGNERITALRRIQQDLDEGGQYDEEKEAMMEELVENVPVKIFPEDMTEREKDLFLAREHVAGKAEWPPLEQAAHMYKMYEEDALTQQEIAELLGRSRSWVSQKINAYAWTEEYLEEYGRENISDFSYFEEAYKKKGQIEDAGLDLDDPDDMAAFHRIVNNKEIPRAIDVRKLPKLLENEETRETLLEDGRGEKALDQLPRVEPSEFSPRFSALTKAKEQLGKMTREDLKMVREEPAFQDLLEEVAAEIEDILEREVNDTDE